jgi:hypothetical protein
MFVFFILSLFCFCPLVYRFVVTFLGEAWFHLSGYVNNWIWTIRNPHVFKETSSRPHKGVTMSRRRITRPLHF